MLAALILAVCFQSLDEIKSTLKSATDKSSYENGAYSAAQSLSEIRTPEAAQLRVELFDTKYDTYRGVYLRDWFYSGYTKSTTQEEGDIMLRAAANKSLSTWHRVVLLRGIERSSVNVSGKLLLNNNFTKEPAVNLAWQSCASVLFREQRINFNDVKSSRNEDELQKLIDMFDKAGAPYLGYAELESLEKGQLAKLINTAASDKNPNVRALAIRVLFKLKPTTTDVAKVCDAAFKKSDTGPRAAVIDSVIHYEIFGAAPLLINYLEAEVAAYPDRPNRFIGDLASCLRQLTGMSFGSSPEIWRNWWNKAGQDWLASAAKGSSEQANERPQSDTVAQFFGIPVDSSNIAILVDGSGSMSTSQLNGQSCASAAASEVDKFLERLPSKSMFTVATIEQQPEFAFKKLIRNSKSNRKKANEFLGRRPYRSTSALYDALDQVSSDPIIDTVLLVSDGGSSAGKHQYSGHLLDAVERLYLQTGVRIHCVLVTDSNKHQQFLTNIASISGGRMVRP